MKAGIIIGHINNGGNESAIIRTAEAFGLNQVLVLGKKRNKYSGSKGADTHMDFKEFMNENELFAYITKNNYSIIAIENVPEAIEMKEVKKYPCNPVFITGHENIGVPKTLLAQADLVVKIRQGHGYTKCLNTGTACSIVIHDFFEKLMREQGGVK